MRINLYINNNKPNKIPSFYQAAIAEYKKRLSRYTTLTIVYYKNDTELTKKLPKTTHLINLTPSTKTISSTDLANLITYNNVKGISDISILISESQQATQQTLSISNLHLSDNLLTTVTLEQIYRAYKIINNEPYHK